MSGTAYDSDADDPFTLPHEANYLLKLARDVFLGRTGPNRTTRSEASEDGGDNCQSENAYNEEEAWRESKKSRERIFNSSSCGSGQRQRQQRQQQQQHRPRSIEIPMDRLRSNESDVLGAMIEEINKKFEASVLVAKMQYDCECAKLDAKRGVESAAAIERVKSVVAEAMRGFGEEVNSSAGRVRNSSGGSSRAGGGERPSPWRQSRKGRRRKVKRQTATATTRMTTADADARTIGGAKGRRADFGINADDTEERLSDREKQERLNVRFRASMPKIKVSKSDDDDFYPDDDDGDYGGLFKSENLPPCDTEHLRAFADTANSSSPSRSSSSSYVPNVRCSGSGERDGNFRERLMKIATEDVQSSFEDVDASANNETKKNENVVVAPTPVVRRFDISSSESSNG